MRCVYYVWLCVRRSERVNIRKSSAGDYISTRLHLEARKRKESVRVFVCGGLPELK